MRHGRQSNKKENRPRPGEAYPPYYRDRRDNTSDIATRARIACAHALMPRMCAPEGRFAWTQTPAISPRLPAPIDRLHSRRN